MIQLQKFEPTDFTKLISWVDSKEMLMQFAGLSFYYPLTEEQLNNHLTDTNRLVFKVVQLQKKETIGHAEIFYSRNVAYLSRILIGENQYRGIGLGLQIVNALTHIIFTNSRFTTAELNVFEWNAVAIKCYTNAGFVINPNKTSERKINGETWIALNMALQKNDWKKTIRE